jgi:hypothetical protein
MVKGWALRAWGCFRPLLKVRQLALTSNWLASLQSQPVSTDDQYTTSVAQTSQTGGGGLSYRSKPDTPFLCTKRLEPQTDFYLVAISWTYSSIDEQSNTQNPLCSWRLRLKHWSAVDVSPLSSNGN